MQRLAAMGSSKMSCLLAVRRGNTAGDHVHRRRFTCAVGAEKAVNLARFDGKTQVLDSRMAAVAFDETFYLNQNNSSLKR